MPDQQSSRVMRSACKALAGHFVQTASGGEVACMARGSTLELPTSHVDYAECRSPLIIHHGDTYACIFSSFLGGIPFAARKVSFLSAHCQAA